MSASLCRTLLVTEPSPIQFGMTVCNDEPIGSTFLLATAHFRDVGIQALSFENKPYWRHSSQGSRRGIAPDDFEVIVVEQALSVVVFLRRSRY